MYRTEKDNNMRIMERRIPKVPVECVNEYFFDIKMYIRVVQMYCKENLIFS